jgi:hypothetical protein
MGTPGVASDIAFRATSCALAAEWKHLTTVAAPVRPDVRDRLEPMWNPVVDLLLILARAALGDTLGDDLLVALLVAGVLAVLALVTERVHEELATEGAEDDLVELPLDELVPIHLVHFVLPGTHGALSAQSTGAVESTLADIFLDYISSSV